MRKKFGIVKDNDAHFYEVEIENLEELVSYLSQKLKYQIDDTILCNYFNRKVHDYGHYQQDILNDRCKILKERKRLIEKENNPFLEDEDTRIGIIDVKVEYKSQISKIINDIFNSKYGMIDLTKLIKLSNYFKNNNSQYNYGQSKSSKEIWINDLEKKLSKEDFKKVLKKLFECVDFRYIGSIPVDEIESPDFDYMYKIAQRNSLIFENEDFEELVNKIDSSRQTKVKLLKKS